MSCFSPIQGWWKLDQKTGKKNLSFSLTGSSGSARQLIPCGQCVGCRLEKSRQMAMRMVHEHKTCGGRGQFLTLTYSDDCLPEDKSLDKVALQLFVKRLREKYSLYAVGKFGDPGYKPGLRFYGIGEYGDENARPHYHVITFNHRFDDLRFYSRSPSGETLYNSASLGELWPFGFNVIGDVTFDSCAYVARYAMKKVLGKKDDPRLFDSSTGVYRQPEFAHMSLKPGIGSMYYAKYSSELLAHDSVVINGREVRPPRFYDTRHEAGAPEGLARLKRLRRRKLRKLRLDNTPDRRRVKEVIALKRLKEKERKL